ncbi:MAG: hypothetical protein COA37_11805 [Hoeflea sp.]|uniref:GGDEF domain-containing protein n=1 Tax=Hoeflea sp. TaxID=1940281 RepID=UPI000C11E094|nr:GGDEF domain-containing protein [Hoeflea sp.]PHR22396.1 MAG: hypothetical protein COA37_11805 [Hoeflea sp.]
MQYAYLSYEFLGPAIFVSAGGAFLLLYLHDRKQRAALRLAGAFLLSAVGYAAVMLGDADIHPAYQAVVLTSLFSGHFMLIWGVASLFGRKVPQLAYWLAAVIAASIAIYSTYNGAMFWLRYAAVSGFTAYVYLLCCGLVWRARSHRVDSVVAALFLIQVLVTLNRVQLVQTSGLDLTTHHDFKSSSFAASMQTENAVFAIAIGLALFARYSVTLVKQLQRLAETDPLTGLLNRRAFEARVQALREASAPLSTGLIICDIDHFKRINDSHGHEVGDRALKAFSRLLERETPASAICTRLGGEEFCIILAGATDESIRLQAIHLRGAVERMKIATGDQPLRLTASFGYSRLDPDHDLMTAMAEVDAAVYQAKNDGRNLVRRAEPAALTGARMNRRETAFAMPCGPA